MKKENPKKSAPKQAPSAPGKLNKLPASLDDYLWAVKRVIESKSTNEELALLYVHSFASGDDLLFKFLENRAKNASRDSEINVTVSVVSAR